MNRFGDRKEEHEFSCSKTRERLEHGYGEE